MSITQTLFERWKVAKGIDSNRAAMRALGLSATANIHWKAGRNADADVIERMANDLGENAGELIAKAMAEQARGEAARTWERIAKQLGAAAVVVLAVAHSVSVAVMGKALINQGLTVYIMSSVRRSMRNAAALVWNPVAPLYRNTSIA